MSETFPRPWKVVDTSYQEHDAYNRPTGYSEEGIEIVDASEDVVWNFWDPPDEATYKKVHDLFSLIVRAVNAHDALVKIADILTHMLEDGADFGDLEDGGEQIYHSCIDALALAKGEGNKWKN